MRGWLAPDPNNDQRARCKVCNKFLNAHKKDLLTHASTKKASIKYDEDDCQKMNDYMHANITNHFDIASQPC